ncbi:MAG TPA: hypothetical protein VMW11_10645 [Candidatus Dormibacteraeota bacterium]|nr:hypothetical protein [Candidatus Dormibacteraeota bacterium]
MAYPSAPGGGDETYVDEPYLSIRWRSVPRMLYAEWKGFATSAETRAAMMTGLRAIREHHVLAYVSDARRAKVFLVDDDLWGKDVWLPAAVAAGLKRMAIVTADTGLGKAQLEQFATEIDDHGLAMRKFDSVAAATNWALTGLLER